MYGSTEKSVTDKRLGADPEPLLHMLQIYKKPPLVRGRLFAAAGESSPAAKG